MQKFVSRSRDWTCHYERARSTPLDPSTCFSVFRNVWVHSGPFRYCTKLGAKWANLLQLMQKFVPQSLIRISRNIRYWSTQLDPKLMFSCVSFCLGAFGTVSLLDKTRNKTGHTGAINGKVRAPMSCYNFTQWMLPIRTIGPHTHLLVRLFPFGCIWDLFATSRNSVRNGPT